MPPIDDQAFISSLLLAPLEVFLIVAFAIGAFLTAPIYFRFANSVPVNRSFPFDTSALVISQGVVSWVVIWIWGRGLYPVTAIFIILSLWLYLFIAAWYCRVCLNSTGIDHGGYRFYFLMVSLLNSFLFTPFFVVMAILFDESNEKVPVSAVWSISIALSLSFVSIASSMWGLRFRSTRREFGQP